MADGLSSLGDLLPAGSYNVSGGNMLVGSVGTQQYNPGSDTSGPIGDLSSGSLDVGSALGNGILDVGLSLLGSIFGGSNNSNPLQANVSEPQPLQGSVSDNSFNIRASQQAPSMVTTQVIKTDIRTTIVQPLQPCRSVPYLKLVFLPVNPDIRNQRELRREVSIPVPFSQTITMAAYMALFEGAVTTKATKYLLRWTQVKPVIIEPQDTGSTSFKSTDIFDLRTSINLLNPSLISSLNISKLPLVQVTQAIDIQGGTLDPSFVDVPLYMDFITYADLNTATGQLIAKDPVDAGIFIG